MRLKDFETVTTDIEQKLLVVFPYFDSGKEITY